ncbi:MAG: hypothetical protein DVB22_001103 [Verrucomicrobia bacterium]|nr:MAG: hypothetical protein DVB22_001103 [Verrucomicrobiota bacterium]
MRPPVLHQDDFTVKGRVAVWIGLFRDEVISDGCMKLDGAFERDFGFRIGGGRLQEMVVSGRPVSIRALVEGFTCWRDSADGVVAAAEEAGITSASLMLVLHSVEFDPKRVTVNPNAPIRFIGNFDSHVSEERSRDRASSFF